MSNQKPMQGMVGLFRLPTSQVFRENQSSRKQDRNKGIVAHEQVLSRILSELALFV
jgi:hypothetical protein